MEEKPLQDNSQRESRQEYMTLEPSYHGENKPRLVLKIITPPRDFDSYMRLASWESQFALIWVLNTRLQKLLPEADLIEFQLFLDHVIKPELTAEKARLGKDAACFPPEWTIRFLNERRIEVYKTKYLRKIWGREYGNIMEILTFLNWRIYNEFKPQLSRIGQYGFRYAALPEAENGNADGVAETAS